MPSPASIVAIGLSLLMAAPVLALTSGSGCLADAGPAAPGATAPGTPSAAPPDARLPQGVGAGWDARQVAVAATIVEVGRARNVPPWGLMALNDLGQSCSPKFPTWWRWSA